MIMAEAIVSPGKRLFFPEVYMREFGDGGRVLFHPHGAPTEIITYLTVIKKNTQDIKI